VAGAGYPRVMYMHVYIYMHIYIYAVHRIYTHDMYLGMGQYLWHHFWRDETTHGVGMCIRVGVCFFQPSSHWNQSCGSGVVTTHTNTICLGYIPVIINRYDMIIIVVTMIVRIVMIIVIREPLNSWGKWKRCWGTANYSPVA
jgi:hypothetical protein